MASNRVWTEKDSNRQRLLVVTAIVAVATAIRERAFARNRERFGS